MEFIGRENALAYDKSHDGRQAPLGGGKWQDSTWLQWWDFENHVGGVHRIGHEYNDPDGPFCAGWTNLVTPEGIFKHVIYVPLREEDKLPNGWGGGDGTCRNEIIDDEHIWTIDSPENDISARLVFKDYCSGTFRGFPSSGATFEHISAHHIDIGGSVTGTINMKGKTFPVKGQGLRDHGWGHRDVNKILSHRYITGCFGPDLWFVAYSVCNGISGTIEMFGWVVKGETVHFVKDIDMVTYAENDSASIRGGHIKLTLPDGEVLDIEHTAVAPGLMSYFHAMFNNNTLCVAECNGRQGAGHWETSMNFYQGTTPPGKMVRALAHNGYYPGAAKGHGTAEADGPFIQMSVL